MSTQPDYQDKDLFGFAVRANFGGRGKPAHAPSDDSRKLVVAMWAMNKTNEYCAAALGISEPTFRKYYFSTKAQQALKENARAPIDALMVSAAIRGAEEGNMAAVKTLRELLHNADMQRLSKEIARGRAEEDEKPEKLGKKDALAKAASEIEGVFAPPKMTGPVN